MTDQPEPDTCRPVEVDGETIRVRGEREMTEQERGYLAEVIAAAKRKYAAEHPQPAPPAHDAGPSVAECADADRHWPPEGE